MPKRNVRGEDWIWVDRMRREQEQLGYEATFAYYGQVYSDAKIRKEINRHVQTLQQQQYSFTPMPAKPEGWVLRICTPTPAPTARSSLPKMSDKGRSTDHSRKEGSLEQTSQAINNPVYPALSAESASKEQSDRRRINTTMLSDIEVDANVKAALEALLKYPSIFKGFNDDLQYLSICLDRGETNHSVKVLQRAFIRACRNRRDQQVTALLLREVSPDLRDRQGTPCLMIAVWNGDESIVRLLVEFGATVDLTDRSGRTSWSIAHEQSRQSEAIVSLLSQAGANPYIGDILDAAANGHTSEVQSMIDRGADPSYVGRKRWWTPLHWAVYKENYELVEVLIRKRAEINAESDEDWTPLDLAWGKPDLYSLLVANGATSGLSRYDQQTLEENLAARSGHETELLAKLDDSSDAEDMVYSMSASMAQMHIDPQEIMRRKSFKNDEKAADISSSPMSWQATNLAGSPEVLKGSPYPISRYLGSSAGSAAVSIKGSSYRSSAHGQASLSLRAILTKKNQGSHKSWATPPMKTPPW